MKRELKELLIRRMADAFPLIDTTEGSAFVEDVVEEAIAFLGNDDFSKRVYDLMLARLRERFPDLATTQADALVDLLVKPLTFMLQPVVAEINRITAGQSLTNPQQLTEDDLHRLAANFFLDYRAGSYTRGVVRLYFSVPRRVVFDDTVFFYDALGNVFIPAAEETISEAELSLRREGSEYYYDVLVRATQAGRVEVPEYSIVAVDGVEGVVRVENPAAFVAGEEKETPEEFVERARESLWSRGLTSPKGIKNRLKEAFPSLKSVEVVTAGEPEMVVDRPVLKTASRAEQHSSPLSFPLTLSHYFTLVTDDGAGGLLPSVTLFLSGTYNSLAELVSAFNTAWTAQGQRGTIASGEGGDRLVISSWSAAQGAESRLRLIPNALLTADGWVYLGFADLGKEIKGALGPLLYDALLGIGPLSLDESVFHIGGIADVYIKDVGLLQGTQTHKRPSGFFLKWQGGRLVANGRYAWDDTGEIDDFSNTPMPLSFVTAADIQQEFVFPNDVTLGDVVSVGGSLRYVVGVSGSRLELDSDLTAAGPWSLYRTCKVGISPSIGRVVVSSHSGWGGVTQGGTPVLLWQPNDFTYSTDPTYWGVQAGDILEIYETPLGQRSEVAGRYKIQELSPGRFVVDRPFPVSSGVRFRVVREAPATKPILSYIEQVRFRLGSINVPIPYALPVAVYSQGVSGGIVRVEGADGKKVAADALESPSTDFDSVGVVVGDVIHISSGTTRQTFTVTGVSGSRLTVDGFIALDGPFVFRVGTLSEGVLRLYYFLPLHVEMQGGDTLSFDSSLYFGVEDSDAIFVLRRPPSSREMVVVPEREGFPARPKADLVVAGKDRLKVWAERQIGVWEGVGSTIAEARRLRYLHAFCYVEGQRVVVPSRCLSSAIDTIGTAYGSFVGDRLFCGRQEVSVVSVGPAEIVTTPVLPPTGRRPEGYARDSSEQTVILLGAGTGDYQQGELVENSNTRLRVAFWDSGAKKLYTYGQPPLSLPSSGTWTGTVSGASYTHVGYGQRVEAVPVHDTTTLRFAGGTTEVPNVSGVFAPDRYLFLYGLSNRTGYTMEDIEDAEANLGVWRIVSVTASEVQLENLQDATKTLQNRSGNLRMEWSLGLESDVVRTLVVTDAQPRAFEILSVSTDSLGTDDDAAFTAVAGGRDVGSERSRSAVHRKGRWYFTPADFSKEGPMYYIDVPVRCTVPGVDLLYGQQASLVVDGWTDGYRADNDSYVGHGWVFAPGDEASSFTATEQLGLYLPARLPLDREAQAFSTRQYVEEGEIEIQYKYSALGADVVELVNSEERPVGGKLRVRLASPALVLAEIPFVAEGDEEAALKAAERVVLGASSTLSVGDIERALYKYGVITEQDYPVWVVLWTKKRQVQGVLATSVLRTDVLSVFLPSIETV